MRTFDEISETTLLQHLRKLHKNAAPGVDGVTRDDFSWGNGVATLAHQLKNGTFIPSPCRKVEIRKPDGRLRPIAIPTIADRVAQRAVSEILTSQYDQRFSNASYGFRPNRNANDAVDRVAAALNLLEQPVVIEFDIVSCFDCIRHEDVLGRLLDDNVDSRVVQLVRAFLGAEGRAVGAPQGGPLSPLIANLVLDRALDQWFPDAVRRHGWGDAVLTRHADDFVVALPKAESSKTVIHYFKERLAAFGLEVHPDKTRYVELRPSLPNQPGGRFEFLGWRLGFHETVDGRKFVRRTSFKSIDRSLKRLEQQMREEEWRRDSLSKRQKWFHSVVRGHRAYFEYPGNEAQVNHFVDRFREAFEKAVARRKRTSPTIF